MNIGSLNIEPFEILLIVTTLLELNPWLQVREMYRNKATGQVSWKTFAMILTIGILWFYYGISINNWPLIVGNAIKLVSSLAVLITYRIYHKRKSVV